MSGTILELTRTLHEDVERLQQGILDDLDFTPKTFRDNVFQTHRVNHYLDKVVESSKKLISIYEDKDGARREELDAMGGHGPNVFSNFYERLREIRDYHRRFPDADFEARPEEQLYFDENDVSKQFTGEEGYGKYLDLHYQYDIYINLKIGQKIDYLTYMDNFFKFTDDLELKDKWYKQYLVELAEYLSSFLLKAQPLSEFPQKIKEVEQEFIDKWESGEFRSWSNSESMEDDSNSDPLYCKACKKSFAKETVFKSHLTGKKHISSVQKLEKLKSDKSPFKEFYALEYKINQLCIKYLSEQIDNTKIYIEKKQSKRWDEIIEELEDEEQGEEPDEIDLDAEEPQIKMTIDNYPVGWDGKPIPYWLYKLHGLGVEYKCEICGNTSYWGRKAYEKHFQEWRHSHGMRCLGIPNTKHFLDITKINDAIALWQKIRKDTVEKQWRAEVEEEYEDKEGNVYNRKTYEDLKRQGLL